MTSVRLPFRGTTIQPHRYRVLTGRGMGSVLLSRGGPGAASSYQDIDDYIHTVGFDPQQRRVLERGSTGSGISKGLESKLKSLSIAGSRKKRPNIVM